MLIGYSMPAATVGVSAGASWLTTDSGLAVLDGKPARKSRLSTGWTATFTTSQYAAVSLVFSSAKAIRIVGLLGLAGCPAGTSVQVWGRRSGDAGRTYNMSGGNTYTVQQFADGSLGVWFVFSASVTAVTELEVRIYNDNGGSTWGAAGSYVDIGEVVAMPVIDVPIRDGWSITTADPSQISLTRGSQRVGVRRRSYRQLSAAFTPQATTAVRGGGLAASMDLERLTAAVTGNARAVVIPQWRTAGAQDNALIQRTALYGSFSEFPAPTNIQGGWFDASFAFDEVPG